MEKADPLAAPKRKPDTIMLDLYEKMRLELSPQDFEDWCHEQMKDVDGWKND